MKRTLKEKLEDWLMVAIGCLVLVYILVLFPILGVQWEDLETFDDV